MEGELARLGEQLVQTAEGTRAIALELCREFEDKFLQHIASGEVYYILLIQKGKWFGIKYFVQVLCIF